MSIKEKILLIALVFCVSLIMIMFGTLIGATSFKDTFSLTWVDAINSLSTLFAAIATGLAALCAWLALSSWKREYSWKASESVKSLYFESLFEYRWAVHQYVLSNVQQGLSPLGETRESEELDGKIKTAKIELDLREEGLRQAAKKLAFLFNSASYFENTQKVFLAAQAAEFSTINIAVVSDTDSYKFQVDEALSTFTKIANEVEACIKESSKTKI